MKKRKREIMLVAARVFRQKSLLATILDDILFTDVSPLKKMESRLISARLRIRTRPNRLDVLSLLERKNLSSSELGGR